MKGFTMKKIFLTVLLMIGSTWSFADIGADGAQSLSNDSRTIVVTTNTASPTQLLTNEPFTVRTWITNYSTFTLFLSTASQSITTSSNSVTGIMIPGATTAGTVGTVWSPDGPMVPYWGPLYGVLGGTSTATNGNAVSIWKSR